MHAQYHGFGKLLRLFLQTLDHAALLFVDFALVSVAQITQDAVPMPVHLDSTRITRHIGR